MKYKPVRDRCCQNEKCQDYRKLIEGNIIRHSKYTTRQGRRRRYLCKTCKKTFGSTKGTSYYRLHKSRLDFDEVVQMTVEGVGISSISRIKWFSWNTIASWQYLACQAAGEFNNQNLKDLELIELQPDEICTFTGTKKKPMWIFVAIEVWSRIWISMEQLLFESEDSTTINTSFIERLNLTIRQSCAYLGRRTACHSRRKDLLADNLELQMCYYNFIRPHSALKFGDETRTPAMQAGLVKKQLRFREIFTAIEIIFWCFFMFLRNRIRVARFSCSPAH